MSETVTPEPPALPAVDPLLHVEEWVFDLDNTLYPAASDLFSQVDRRMGEFIARLLDIPYDEARLLQKSYFRQHGTTLRGLMTVHAIDPAEFLSYVHDIDVSAVAPSPALDAALARLPGRKMVFTNGSVAHVERVLARLGVERHFGDVFDIVASDYLPKPNPQPYRALVDRFGIRPERAVMVEDMARNLLPARALGMTTVWVRTPTDWGQPQPGDDHIDHTVDDTAEWLFAVAEAREGAAPAGTSRGRSAAAPSD